MGSQTSQVSGQRCVAIRRYWNTVSLLYYWILIVFIGYWPWAPNRMSLYSSKPLTITILDSALCFPNDRIGWEFEYDFFVIFRFWKGSVPGNKASVCPCQAIAQDHRIIWNSWIHLVACMPMVSEIDRLELSIAEHCHCLKEAWMRIGTINQLLQRGLLHGLAVTNGAPRSAFTSQLNHKTDRCMSSADWRMTI